MKPLKTIKPSKINPTKTYLFTKESIDGFDDPEQFVAKGEDIIEEICDIFDYDGWLDSDLYERPTDPKKALQEFLKWVDGGGGGDSEYTIYISGI